MRAAWFAAAAWLCTSGGATAPEVNLERAQQLYVICGACHGARAQGERALETPALAGQNGEYLLRQLRLFASGARGLEGDQQGRQMRQILETISSEDDWKQLIAYIGTLPVKDLTPPASDAGSRGHELYQTCAVCHGAAGEGSAALKAPRLVSLSQWYIANQLRKFRTGLRGAGADDRGRQMRAAASMLQSDADVAAVAEYIGASGQ